METNRLIAEFMGRSGKLCDTLYTFKGVSDLLEDDIWYTIEQSKFHTSWDWLMPVIEKIETLGYKFEKNYQPIDKDWQSLIVKGNDILYQEFSENSLDSSYYVVVKFIKEYNKQN